MLCFYSALMTNIKLSNGKECCIGVILLDMAVREYLTFEQRPDKVVKPAS